MYMLNKKRQNREQKRSLAGPLLFAVCLLCCVIRLVIQLLPASMILYFIFLYMKGNNSEQLGSLQVEAAFLLAAIFL